MTAAARVPDEYAFIYFSGYDSPEVAAAASRRSDIGLVITPKTAHYLNRVHRYAKIIVDNGAFQKMGFRPKRFLRLLDRIAARPQIAGKVQFVVAPDVPGDARRTLGLYRLWEPLIRERALRVALAAQDGLEHIADEVPWHQVDAFFIGGTTWWKLGAGETHEWDQLLRRAEPRPIHFGRVNSMRRMDFAWWMGATSADGTAIKFCPDRLHDVERWLDYLNTEDVLKAPPKPWQWGLELAGAISC